jgi:hypothetical protein
MFDNYDFNNLFGSLGVGKGMERNIESDDSFKNIFYIH